MKVKISKYKRYWGPYQLVELFTPIFGEARIDAFTDTALFDGFSNLIMPTCAWFDRQFDRTEYVKIDKWDSYSADHTLALIIAPVLTQLKETKHGSPFTDDEDVPVELRSTSAKPLSQEDVQNGELDEFFHKRYEWILDEMIWAFNEIKNNNWESQFHHGTSDWIHKKYESDKKEDEDDELFEIKEGPNHTATFDSEGYTAHFKRIERGTTLFGKYYSSLWD